MKQILFKKIELSHNVWLAVLLAILLIGGSLIYFNLALRVQQTLAQQATVDVRCTCCQLVDAAPEDHPSDPFVREVNLGGIVGESACDPNGEKAFEIASTCPESGVLSAGFAANTGLPGTEGVSNDPAIQWGDGSHPVIVPANPDFLTPPAVVLEGGHCYVICRPSPYRCQNKLTGDVTVLENGAEMGRAGSLCIGNMNSQAGASTHNAFVCQKRKRFTEDDPGPVFYSCGAAE